MVQQHEKKYIPYLLQFELSSRQSYFQMLQRNRFERQGLSYFNCETESNTNYIMNEIKKNHHQEEGKNLSNLHQIIDVKLNHKDHQLAQKIHIALRFGKHIFKIQYKKRPTMRFKKKLVIRDCKCCGLKMKRHKCTHTLCSINCTILKQYRNRIKKQSGKKQIQETIQEVVSKVVKNMLQKIDKIINNIVDEQDQNKSQMILEEDESQNENHQSQYVKNSSLNDEFEQQQCAQKNQISLNQQKLSLEEGKEEQEEQKKQKEYEEYEEVKKVEKVQEQQEEAENYENLN